MKAVFKGESVNHLKYFLLFSGLGLNHMKHNCTNQASSDSELAKYRTTQLGDLDHLELNPDFLAWSEDKDGAFPSKGMFLPNVQNMKHNVSQKVAQVRHTFFVRFRNE